ncbi:ArsC/Spx/MgsR family protein [Motiliproteus sp. SC1-56]|uniref:ArsC/Spx/MgsR family protein n=1 Tax=Motiliproteus sp. SC1-56 TaxID=2799565 RepID=UPI001A8DCC79|nr:ArsC/Spx/MgsR family protein [Motiliproteus sp. SC1-56]
MAVIEFYEKPGCAGNARQKQLLEKAGHHLVVHDLLAQPWTPSRLRRYFGRRPVAEWFNRSAPAVKRGEVVPESLDAKAALKLLVADPLLIRRPLMRLGQRRWVGFEPAVLSGLLSGVPEGNLEVCPRRDDPCDGG